MIYPELFRQLRLMVLILYPSWSNTVCPSLSSKSRGGLDGTLDWCVFVRHSLVCSNLLSVCYIYSHKYAFHWNPSTTSTELNEVDGTLSGGGCRCYHAHLVDDKIIQHELLMSWIIACFHGYGPTECVACSQSGDGKDGSGKIKTAENLKTLLTGLVADAIAGLFLQTDNMSKCAPQVCTPFCTFHIILCQCCQCANKLMSLSENISDF